MAHKPRRRMTIVDSLDEIPQFASEEEEHVFWSTHSFSEKLLSEATWDPDDPLAPIRSEQARQTAKR